jgi:signal transduction histidine kinase
VIQGNAELLRERVVDGESRSYVDAIETRAETLAIEGQKAADIQALFSDDVSAAARYDPCPAIESTLAEFEAEYPAVDFSLRCSVSTPVRADDRLGVAISELISNAVRHNERTDLAVRVSVECTSVDGDADWVDIVVADTGAGIPPHERDIIESGRETPLEHTTGLGLWLVYWTASLFGGEVSIRHVDGETQVHLRVLAVDDADGTDADADAETVDDSASWLVDAATTDMSTEPSADS